jgi:hypothetical protein
MARLKSQEDVDLAKIKADLERARLISNTVVWCFSIFWGVVSIGIIAWATVQITDKPAWLELGLAILGAGSTPSVIAWRLYVRLKRLTASIERDEGTTSSIRSDQENPKS